MKLRMSILATGVAALWLVGCSATGGSGVSADGKVGAAMDVVKAATVSEDDLKSAALQLRAAEDKQARVAPPNNRYAKRLARLTKNHVNEDGLVLNYKVYLSPQVNANATPDGSIRVYSGLMDLMNDDELRGVIGHEIGHVGLGHSKARMQTAYAASAARTIAGNSGGAIAALSRSQAGDLAEKVINAQFSQSQESAADDYSFDLLTEKKMNRQGLVTAFQKLAKLSGGSSGASSIMSSHPPSEARAKRMQERLDGKK